MATPDPKLPPTPAEQLVALIDAHAYSPMVLMSPLAKVLPALRRYIVNTEARIDALERVAKSSGWGAVVNTVKDVTE